MHVGMPILSIFHSCGGMERSGTYLAGALLARGYEVTIFYREKRHPDDPPQYPLPEGVNLVALPDDQRFPGLVEETRRKILESGVDVLLGLMFGTEFLSFPLALMGTGIPLIISERNVPDVSEEEWDSQERLACMTAADRIHLLSHGFVSSFPLHLRERVRIIPNFTARNTCSAPDRQMEKGEKILLGVGRFDEKHKQFSLLLKAFAMLAKQFPEWKLIICGSGKMRIVKFYERIIARHGLKDRILLPGKISDVAAFYGKAHLFCIPSRYEAFGLVSAEAHSFGLPVVGFADCPGTNEIVVDGENGLLAEEMTARSLADRLAVLMGDPVLRRDMGRRGWDMLDRYDEEAVFDRWESLLQETFRAKGKTALQHMVAVGSDASPEWLILKRLAARPFLFEEKKGIRKIAKKVRKSTLRLKRCLVGKGKGGNIKDGMVFGRPIGHDVRLKG